MKDMIIGYITALANNYERKIESLKENKIDEITIENFNSFKATLEDLLIFTEDNSEIEICSLKEEVTMLRKRVQELEESCEDMCEIEENLHKQIATFKINNSELRKVCKRLREKNECLSVIAKENIKSYRGSING